MLLHMNRNEKFLPGTGRPPLPPTCAIRMCSCDCCRSITPKSPHVCCRLARARSIRQQVVCRLCVHVLPFRALMAFMEKVLEHGHVPVPLALQLVASVSDKLLSLQQFDTANMFALLRLDPALLPERNTDPTSSWRTSRRPPPLKSTQRRLPHGRAEEMAKIEARLARIRQMEAETRTVMRTRLQTRRMRAVPARQQRQREERRREVTLLTNICELFSLYIIHRCSSDILGVL